MDLGAESPSWRFARELRDQQQRSDDPFITFRVACLRVPESNPAWVGDISSSSFSQWRWGERPVQVEGVHEVTLFFGATAGSGGAGVTVSTGLFGRVGLRPPPLEFQLASHVRRVGPGHEDPSLDLLDFPLRSGELRIGDGVHEAEIACHTDSWAARTRLPLGRPDPLDRLLVVTVAATGVAEKELRLDWIDDLHQFADERRRMDDAGEREVLDRVAAVAAVLPADLDVHRAFIEANLGLPITGLAVGGESTDGPAMGEARRGALGHAAIEAQARLRVQEIGQATAAISSMLAHMRALADKASWFRSDPKLRDGAVDETVAFVSRGQEVKSQSAQQAWDAYRGGALSRLFGGTSPRAIGLHSIPDPSSMIPEESRELFERMRDAVRDPSAVSPEEGRAMAEQLRETIRHSPRRAESIHDTWIQEWEHWAAARRLES